MHSLPNVSFCIYAEIFTSMPNLPFKDFVSINTHLYLISLKLKSMERCHEWGDDSIEKNRFGDRWFLPKGKTLVDCKWIFIVKYKSDGSLERYKARLVAKEYTQTYSVDYHETFALVTKMNTIIILLSLATIKDCSLHQSDMKNVFLHGDLREEVYKERGQKNKVCRLKKSLMD